MKTIDRIIKIFLFSCFIYISFTCYNISKPIIEHRLTPFSYKEFHEKHTHESSILPPYCYNIYYSSHAEWQIISSFIRFEVPENQLDKTVQFLTDEFFINEKVDLSKSEKMVQLISIPDTLLPLPWWDINNIKNGYSLESKNGSGYIIWIDNLKNIIYIYYTQ